MSLLPSLQLKVVFSLLQVLDQIPFPLMVQTGKGKVVIHNRVWRQQLAEIENLEQLQAQLAPLLAGRSSAGQEHSNNREEEDDVLPYTVSAYCQSGSTPTSGICFCTLKNGQEKVWQFTRKQLQVTPSSNLNPVVERVSAAVLEEEFGISAKAEESPPFTLAALLGHDLPLEAIDQLATHPAVVALTQWLSLEDPATEPNSGGVLPPETGGLWLVLAHDQTEQQQVSQELAARNADLMQLNHLKDDFLACISHELKTPLTAILGLARLLQDSGATSLNDRQMRYVRLIQHSGRQLSAIVNDILDLTRMESGQLALAPEVVNIALVCERAWHQVGVRMAEGLALEIPKPEAAEMSLQQHFSLHIQPGLDYIIADELRLQQMLMHLLSNAVKFTEAGGSINLTVARWEGWIAFTVVDTGIGIPEHKQHLIFQKFQQLENPLTRRFEGTGLGLVLTQRLAHLHGGDITFTSQAGKGSQFTLLLPPSPPHRQPSEDWSASSEEGVGISKPPPLAHSLPLKQASSPAPHLSSRLVLVVDTDAQRIDDLASRLMGLDYWVAIARSGTEALEKVRRLQPCVVFLNPFLPQLSGWDVLTLLKTGPMTRQVPIVVIANRADRSLAMQHQANEFLSLPLQTDQLERVVQELTSDLPLSSSDRGVDTATVVNLTVLLIHWLENPAMTTSFPIEEIAQLLQPHHRLLEVDDLDQAELLIAVWKPDVILLDLNVTDPQLALLQISQRPLVAALPIVTLDQATTQAANQTTGLSIFPCLVPPTTRLNASPGQAHTSALLQVIQVAAGIHWQPCILTIDLLTGQSDWLKALRRYLQLAGYRGLVGQSWTEVATLVKQQKVDLLLLCCRCVDLHQSDLETKIPLLQEALSTLQSLPPQLPVLWLDPFLDTEHHAPPLADFQAVLQTLRHRATHTLSPSLSMSAMLEGIRHLLTH